MKLAHEVIGSGPEMLAIHGGLGHDHTGFLPFIEDLPARITLPDLRGCGESSREGIETATFDTFTSDLDELRTAPQWIVLGHSFGSFIAQEYALRYPSRVRALILVCSTPAFDHAPDVSRATPEQLALLGKAMNAPLSSDQEYADGWKLLLPLYFHGPVPAGFMNRVHYSAPALFRGFQLLPSFNTLSRLSQIHCPTLVIGGRHDFITPPGSGTERLGKGIAGAQVSIFEESGHYPFVEEREKFTRVTSDFLRSLP